MNQESIENEDSTGTTPAVLEGVADLVTEKCGEAAPLADSGSDIEAEFNPDSSDGDELQLRPPVETLAGQITITRAPRNPAKPLAGARLSNQPQAPFRLEPDPAPLLPIIATSVVEIIAGTRSVEQLAPVLSEGVYQSLRARAILENRTRALGGITQRRPRFVVSKVHMATPTARVVESVVLITSPARTRAVAIRLEQVRARWRATSLAIL